PSAAGVSLNVLLVDARRPTTGARRDLGKEIDAQPESAGPRTRTPHRTEARSGHRPRPHRGRLAAGRDRARLDKPDTAGTVQRMPLGRSITELQDPARRQP